MQHLDEGTIHAWLDGELPFDESSRVTAHAESCARCSAMIAEARGFIAASTRILRNLDEVPAGVIPPSAPGTTDGHTGFTPRDWGIVLPVPRPAAPKRWIPSRFAAAAAFAIMAVGVYTVMNRGNHSAMSEIGVPVSDAAAPVAAGEVLDSARSSAVSPDVKDAATQEATEAKAAPAPSAPVQNAVTTAPSRAPSLATGQVAQKRTDVVVTGAAGNRERAQDAAARTPPPAAATLPPPDLADARKQFTKVAPAAAAAAAKMDSDVANKTLARAAQAESARSVAREESLQASRTAEPKRLAVPPDSTIESERRRLVGEVQSRTRPITTTGTTLSDGRQRLATKLTVTTAVGCYDLRRGDAANEAGAPSWVRLANVPVRVGSRTLRLALPEGQPQGEDAERWYWSLGSGAIVLHKVVGGVVRFEGPVAAVRRAC